ncbi:MRN complex-interacting protein isoform X3 [Tupaia chinensis]|uniref:MRN complex-interacting protein isoform X3 n=1 Tax=Tupaia chinensis TaxID=246437 RepID=UPI00070443B0|nr:MRN complex-interacting protein isoform X3 [Tupaia chinensis]
MKKSVKWTCKACGEKQSFLRAYGEGSGADCRRHVQKLNLLQGEVAEMSFSLHLPGHRAHDTCDLPPRSPEAPVGASEEEGTGSLQAGARLQETRPPPESRWLKYLEDDCGQGLDGACSPRQPSPSTGKPGPAFHQNLPRKSGARARLLHVAMKPRTAVTRRSPGHPRPRRCHLATAHMWTESEDHRQGVSSQPALHCPSKAPLGPGAREKATSAGPLLSSFPEQRARP